MRSALLGDLSASGGLLARYLNLARSLGGGPLRTIYKYPLALKVEQSITTKMGATLLHVGAQHGRVTIWADIPDVDAIDVTLGVRIVGTGNAMPEDMTGYRYVGTAFLSGFVWHVYAEEVDGGTARSEATEGE